MTALTCEVGLLVAKRSVGVYVVFVTIFWVLPEKNGKQRSSFSSVPRCTLAAFKC